MDQSKWQQREAIVQQAIALAQDVETERAQKAARQPDAAFKPFDIENLGRTETARSFCDFVKGLSLEDARFLIAVMYLGRGDSGRWKGMIEATSDQFDTPSIIASQMIGKKRRLVAYLRDGLSAWRRERDAVGY